jgi:hypothetical protein
MNQAIAWLVVAIVVLSLLVSAGPILVGLAHAASSLVLAVGAMIIVGRLVWYWTNR